MLTVPAVDRLLQPAVTVVPLQLLAYNVAVELGLDVDSHLQGGAGGGEPLLDPVPPPRRHHERKGPRGSVLDPGAAVAWAPQAVWGV